ncbi:hypothetical protein F4781DRAFT_441886 [Annulohypoxylon bovei var. microspora]|nr:hypothetical protein F4781DRAFT_441886 [Annulohypoxylon bovei var. microspora]
MTTAVTTSALQSDLEKGQAEPSRTRLTSYVRDITYKVIPFCIVFLVVLSIGAILITTLNFKEVLPSKETVVVSIMLLVFFLLFCIGGMYLYCRKRYRPLNKGPNAPDRPLPKTKGWKERASVIGTLTIGKFRLGKIHRHRVVEAEVNPQGGRSNPAELASQSPPPGQQSNTARNQFAHLDKKALQRVPVPRHHPSPYRNSHYMPSEEAIPEGFENNEPPNLQDYIPNDMNTLASQGHSTSRNKRTPSSNEEVVSPMSHNSATFHRFSAYSPGVRTTSTDRNPQAQDASPKTTQNPQAPRARETPDRHPKTVVSPQPEQVRLNAANAEPLANLVRIPGCINERAFADALPENCLYIFKNPPSNPDDEHRAASSGCECQCEYYYMEQPRDQVHTSKTGKSRTYVDQPRGLGIDNTAHEVQEGRYRGGRRDEDDRNRRGYRSTTFYRPRAEPERYETGKKGHKISHQQKESQSRTSDSHEESSDRHSLPELPEAPRKTKPPSLTHKNPESVEVQVEEGRRRRYYMPRNYSKPMKEPSGRPPNKSRDQQQYRENRGRRANTMSEGYPYKQNSLKPVDQEWLNIRPEPRFPDHHPYYMRWPVPPRSSSRGFADYYETTRRTASESSSTISDDYRQYE